MFLQDSKGEWLHEVLLGALVTEEDEREEDANSDRGRSLTLMPTLCSRRRRWEFLTLLFMYSTVLISLN
ncbi:hypothetical protein PIB30_036130 [Stylosanthes scabra]|uniref:Uncharacterized protein n=1 Tax=Stylosanthes scabra TaxID=79078 RepID=A0ABU6WBE4_9FABA|nr:hypothetical protein [Stylosanthes scabra]